MRHPLTRLCENVARAFQPEGLSDSSRWSKRSADHRTTNETIFHPEKAWQKTVEPLQGSGELFASFRWSALRSDHRLLSDSPSGWGHPLTQVVLTDYQLLLNASHAPRVVKA